MERYELLPIGNSSDFNISGSQTSWYLLIDGIMYLFDVPYSTAKWALTDKGQIALHDIDQIVIFITSLKESRVGGLKTFMDILIGMNKKRMVFIPIDIWLKGSNYVEIVGGILSEFHMIRGEYFQDNNVQIFPREVDHDGIIKSFAYMIYGGDLFINHEGTNWSVYYSPDNRTFMDEAVIESFITDPREKTIYQCITTNIDDETHCYRDRVVKIIPKELRSHIYPINIDDNKDIKKLRNQGFNI